ncbi:MAG: response regulator [Balneolales bacterium]
MSKANILIVEDNFLIAQDMQNILEQAGYTISAVVDTGELAISNAAELKPDLIILDIVLKGDMDGIETLKMIREHSDVPVLFVTGNQDLLIQHHLNEPWLDKPFTALDLQRLASSLLGG